MSQRAGSGPVHQRVREQARRDPAARAVIDAEGALSYGELDEASGRVAAALVAAGARPDDRICLLIPKSAHAVAAILGVLRAGCVYVPLDPASPPARLAQVVRTSAPSILLARPDRARLAADCLKELAPHERPGVLDLAAALAAPADGDGPDSPGAPNGLAYLLFTSGSTGRPKGVAIGHANVEHFVTWANEHFGLGPQDRVSGHSPLHFDLSVWDVFGALTAGAELHLVPDQANLLPERTAAFIRDAQLTQWFSVPSVLTAMAGRDVLSRVELPHLRRLIWCGEVFPASGVRYFAERLPRVRMTNLYGPTEATIASSYYEVENRPWPEDAAVPLGLPVPGEQLRVCGPDRAPVPAGTIGDLYIGGAGLGPGYWRDPQRTAEAYHESPPGSGLRWYRTGDLASVDATGLFHFHGRQDRQIKSRGHRIELDDIEVALSALPEVEQCAVIAVPDERSGQCEIAAVCVPAPGFEPTSAALRGALAQRLPPYMLPRAWRFVPKLPTSQSGKIDRRALADTLERPGPAAVPRNEEQR